MTVGLSSLGRLESRVVPALEAVETSLAALCGTARPSYPPVAAFFAGERLLAARTREVLGPSSMPRGTALLVTCPSDAADGPDFIRSVAASGVEALRINCAHDDAAAWERMIGFARAAEAVTGRRLRVLMDLAGPKIRTGAVRHPPRGQATSPRTGCWRWSLPGGLATLPDDAPALAAECQLSEALRMVRPGDAILFDDAKVRLVGRTLAPWGVVARVVHATASGAKLREEKGLSFPDTELVVPPLTPKDLADLDFVARHADGISYSFVQSAEDVVLVADGTRGAAAGGLAAPVGGAEGRDVAQPAAPAGDGGAGGVAPAGGDHDRTRRSGIGDRVRAHCRDAGGDPVDRRGGAGSGDLGHAGHGEHGQARHAGARRDDGRRHGGPRGVRDAEQGAVPAGGDRRARPAAVAHGRSPAQEDAAAAAPDELVGVARRRSAHRNGCDESETLMEESP